MAKYLPTIRVVVFLSKVMTIWKPFYHTNKKLTKIHLSLGEIPQTSLTALGHYQAVTKNTSENINDSAFYDINFKL